MRVALVHYWLVNMRGGEKVLEELCELFPQADVFTHAYRPERISPVINRHRVHTTFISRLPYASRLYQSYLPLMPFAIEHLDLRAYDLVISSESGPAKGVITAPDALHLCYCHTPMRYVWNMYHDYSGRKSAPMRWMTQWLLHRLRQWDCQSADRVDGFVANSHNVAQRIRKYYRREAAVVYPPVDVEFYDHEAPREDFYLYVGQLTRYKRADIAVEAFTRCGRKLVLIGDGEDAQALRKMAGPTVTFLGRQPAEVLRDNYARCRALVFPGEEDFGIVPVEAMAAGAPVIAFDRGGVRETVVPDLSGVLFGEQTPEALLSAIAAFERTEARFQRKRIVAQARHFSRNAFREGFMNALCAASVAAESRITPELLRGRDRFAATALAGAA